MNKIKKNKKWIFLTIICLIFLFLLNEALEPEVMFLDDEAYKLVLLSRNELFTEIMRALTMFASPIILIITTIITMIFFKNRRQSIRLVFNLGFVTCLNQILKFVIRRERPIGYRLIEETGFSFPSGHSMVSLAFYGYFIYLVWKSSKSQKTKIVYTILLSILILSIGFSRVYLGVHYASDVIAGMCLSLGYLIIYTAALKKINIKKGE